ncbi:recombinase family protein [Bdellovibrionota bacterium FG-1]
MATQGSSPKCRVGLYARISTQDQKTLSMQLGQMRRYVKDRGWRVAFEVRDIGSGAKDRPRREEVLKAARKREIDIVLVWKLDRWGRSLVDLVTTLKELSGLGVGFISLTEALDLTTPTGRAMTGLLAVFAEFEREILRERIKAGIAHAKSEGRVFGRPKTAGLQADQIRKLKLQGMNHSAIARKLKVGRTSVRRLLGVGSRRVTRSAKNAQ